MIVTAHQPGYLPGVSVVSKIARADAVVWLDDVRFTTPGFVNRNQLPDGTWLTVPVERRDHLTPIREVQIGEEGWQRSHVQTLADHYRDAPHFDRNFFLPLGGPLSAPGSPLLELNLALTDRLFAGLGLSPRQYRQSEHRSPSGSLTTKLIHLVKSVGGTAYLSGPTDALDPELFAEADLELLYFHFAGDNPSVIDPLFREGTLPTTPHQEVNVA